jgi:hypothetical protein
MLGSTQAMSHGMRPPEQVRAHIPALQNMPEGQALPQRPQLKGSVETFVQLDPPQNRRGVSQESIPTSPVRPASDALIGFELEHADTEAIINAGARRARGTAHASTPRRTAHRIG